MLVMEKSQRPEHDQQPETIDDAVAMSHNYFNPPRVPVFITAIAQDMFDVLLIGNLVACDKIFVWVNKAVSDLHLDRRLEFATRDCDLEV